MNQFIWITLYFIAFIALVFLHTFVFQQKNSSWKYYLFGLDFIFILSISYFISTHRGFELIYLKEKDNDSKVNAYWDPLQKSQFQYLNEKINENNFFRSSAPILHSPNEQYPYTTNVAQKALNQLQS
jgi:hypothetical protein